MTEKINWNAEAERAVKMAFLQLHEAHRGAFLWHAPTNTMLLFANDEFPFEQLAILTDRFADIGIEVRASAVFDADGEPHSMAVLVEHHDVDLMTDWLWEAWWAVTGDASNVVFESTERRIAADCVARHVAALEHPGGHKTEFVR